MLLLVGIIDGNDDWIGGTTNAVQCGDQRDGGSTKGQILGWFEKLRFQAKAAGGTFYPLNGNHEVWNVKLNFQDVDNPGGFDEFADVYYHPNDLQMMALEAHIHRRAAAFWPGGPYTKMLAQRKVILNLEKSCLSTVVSSQLI